MSRPRILVVDDEPQYGELYAHTLTRAGFEVEAVTSAHAAHAAIARARPALVISDVRMPGESGLTLLERARARDPELPFLLVTAYADVRDAVASLKLGAIDYLAKPVDLDELIAVARDLLGRDAHSAAPDELPHDALRGIVAESPAMRAALRDAWRVAPSDATVLITGESGAGKEVIAQFIHKHSGRASQPLISVNCAALPSELLLSELFGHTRGAFSGAVSARTGRFREADGATLLLDEIGDMPLEHQPALLRALETREITPVGSDRPTRIDTRIIAATHQSLEDRISQGAFRSDLYYRLNVIAIEVPPLRERRADILPLARHMLAASGADGLRLSSAVSRALEAYPWPGNVRELANAMTRAALMARGGVVMPEHLPAPLRAAQPSAALATDDATQTLLDAEIATIRRALEETDGNRTHAATLLGITRRGLIKKLKRLELDV